MFLLTMGSGTDFGWPDVCITSTGEVTLTIPYPNVAETVTSSPTADNVLVDCMPVINLMSQGLVSAGDDLGMELGVVSHTVSAEVSYKVGCFTIFIDGLPAQRLTSITGQNCNGVLPNGPGMCITPSQVTVLALG